MPKVYVGNLPFSATEDEIRELFSRHGPVASVELALQQDTQRSRGFCFLEMGEEGAKAAVAEFDGYDFKGRVLKVSRVVEPGTG